MCLALGMLIIVGSYVSAMDPSKFEETLKTLVRRGMNDKAFQDYINNVIQFEEKPADGQAALNELITDVETKFRARLDAVIYLRNVIVENYATFKHDPKKSPYPACCSQFERQFDSDFKQETNREFYCIHGAGLQNNATLYPATETLNDAFKKNENAIPKLHYQYFGSETGLLIAYPAVPNCDPFDSRYRPWYVLAATPKPKDIVIVMDKSGSMNTEHKNGKTLMFIAKDAADTVVRTLSPDDRVGIVTFSTEASTPRIDSCYGHELAQATPQNINYLTEGFIKKVSVDEIIGTNYIPALQKAFQMIENTPDLGDERDKMILFLTDGKPNDDHTEILEVISRNNAMLANKVVILTFGLGASINNDAKNILAKMARQEMYDPTAGVVKPGLFTHVKNPDDLRGSMASYYNFSSQSGRDRDEVLVTVPYPDTFGSGLLNGMCLPVYIESHLVGVVCVDIIMANILSDVAYSSHGHNSYPILIDGKGRTFIHPLLPLLDNVKNIGIFVHVSTLEREQEAIDMIESMTEGGKGSKTYVSTRVIPRGIIHQEGVRVINIDSQYVWDKVPGTNFSVCVVEAVNGKRYIAVPESIPEIENFNYHNLELGRSTEYKVCSVYGLKATDGSSIQFSPAAFTDPYTYLNDVETAERVDEYEAIMKRLAPDNVFKQGVLDTVAICQILDEMWKANREAGNNFNIYLYFASEDGVYYGWPGIQAPKKYNHLLRPWYRRAIGQNKLYVMSPPYLDAFGSGYIISFNKAIFETSSSDVVIGVIGMDFTVQHFYFLLLDHIEDCNSNECFLMDNSGYLIIHEEFLTNLRQMDNIHITDKEPNFARFLWSNGYVRNSGCVDFESLREYRFSVIDLFQVIQTADFDVHPIKDTNMILVVKMNVPPNQQSCHCQGVGIENSPCGSSNSSTCRCNCHTGASFAHCKDRFNINVADDAWPVCPPQAPDLDYGDTVPDDATTQVESLPRCFADLYQCDNFSTIRDCISHAECCWHCDECVLSLKCRHGEQNCNEQPDDRNPKMVMYIAIACGSVIFIGVLITLVVCCHFKKKGKAPTKENQNETDSNYQPIGPRTDNFSQVNLQTSSNDSHPRSSHTRDWTSSSSSDDAFVNVISVSEGVLPSMELHPVPPPRNDNTYLHPNSTNRSPINSTSTDNSGN